MSAPIRVALFSHKAGVGKTTLIANVAFALAELGRSVLVVDGDPQCDLTSYLLADDVVDKLLGQSDGPNGRTIWSALTPVANGDRTARVVAPVQVGPIALLAGDIRLADFEESLNGLWADCLRRRLPALYATSSISTLVTDLVAEHRYDYVLFDTGPNLGALNRVLLLDSDCFILPVGCDLLSVRALTTIGRVVGTWMRDADTINAIAPDNMPLLAGKPALLGYVPQRFRVHGQAAAKDASIYVRELKSRIHDDVGRVLREQDHGLAPPRSEDPVLGPVEDFTSLVHVAYREGVPMWKCSGGTPAERNTAKCTFMEIASAVVASRHDVTTCSTSTAYPRQGRTDALAVREGDTATEAAHS